MNSTKKTPPVETAGVKPTTKKFLNYSTGKIEINETSPPYSEGAEIGVLEACIANSSKMEMVRAIIGPDDFYSGGTKAVFKRMLELYANDPQLTGPPYLIRIEKSFERHADYEKFRELFDKIRSVTGEVALHFARIVREMADRREIIKLTYLANLQAFDPAFDIKNIIRELMEPLTRLGGRYHD